MFTFENIFKYTIYVDMKAEEECLRERRDQRKKEAGIRQCSGSNYNNINV